MMGTHSRHEGRIDRPPLRAKRLEPRRVVSAHIGACACCRICPVLVRLSMHVLFTELPKVTCDRLHLTDGETFEIATDLQEFGLKVPTRRVERPRAPPRVRVKWMLVVAQVHRRQGDPLIGIESLHVQASTWHAPLEKKARSVRSQETR